MKGIGVKTGTDSFFARMFGFFRRRDWKPEVLPQLEGSFAGLHVLIRNFPCLSDSSSGERKYRYGDFGSEFHAELIHRQLADFEHVRQILAAGARKTVLVRLRDLPTIQVEVQGRPSDKPAQFYSDLADAPIEAFQSQQVRP
jgi:hypothetical protein